jgi:chemotaxis protein MotB
MRRRRSRLSAERGREAVAHDRWLLSYSDLVTLLLAVFIVLFAFSRGHKQPTIQTMSAGIHSGFEQLSLGPPNKGLETAPSGGNSPVPHPPGPMPPSFDAAALKKQLQSVLGDAIDKDEIVMQRSSEGLTISLRDFGFFKSGDARLLPGAADQIKRTAQVLIEHGLEVRVEGHSDDQPIHTAEFHSNWELSTARAAAVLSLLLDDARFPPEKLSVAGYGSYRPVADNSTPEGRRMNRRVDLVVIAPKTKVDPPR